MGTFVCTLDSMRWYTDEAYAGDHAAWDRMLTAYSSHVARLGERLPPDLATLATDPALNMHDASVHTMHVDLDRGTLDMVVFLYDRTALIFRFEDFNFRGPGGSEDDLRSIAYAIGATYTADGWNSARTQILAQEVDVAEDGRYALRLRLWPFYEFEILFRAISMTVEQAPPNSEPAGKFVVARA